MAKKNKKKVKERNSVPSPKRKMSEMLSEMAAGFLWVGDTIAERQNRLLAACAAWNIASGPPENRRPLLEQYKKGYLRSNPATSPEDLANVARVMEAMVEQKLKLFPHDRRQIVDARVVTAGSTFRIEVVSATFR
jgi:hypothetical protein